MNTILEKLRKSKMEEGLISIPDVNYFPFYEDDDFFNKVVNLPKDGKIHIVEDEEDKGTIYKVQTSSKTGVPYLFVDNFNDKGIIFKPVEEDIIFLIYINDSLIKSLLKLK